MAYVVFVLALALAPSASPMNAPPEPAACTAGSEIRLTPSGPDNDRTVPANTSPRSSAIKVEAVDGCSLNVIGLHPTGIRRLLLEGGLHVVLPGDLASGARLRIEVASEGVRLPDIAAGEVSFEHVRRNMIVTLHPAPDAAGSSLLMFNSDDVLVAPSGSHACGPDCAAVTSYVIDGATLAAPLHGNVYAAGTYQRLNAHQVLIGFHDIERSAGTR